MNVLETLEAVRRWRAAREAAESRRGSDCLRSIGLVPTMGYLHEGHLSLVTAARGRCQRVVASIFVNPAQFDRTDDLEAYPRDFDRDRDLLESAGCDAIFLPTPALMYPPGFETWVEPGNVADGQEGTHRPGHFRGVATVVLKLLNIVQPTHAFFGQKDAQQLAVISTMVRDLDVPVEIVPVPTVREADGLAFSSRNVRLEADQRRAAPVLHAALEAAADAFRDGERRSSTLIATARQVLDGEPLARTEYVDVTDPDTMRDLEAIESRGLISLAVWIGDTRLIDNVTLNVSEGNST